MIAALKLLKAAKNKGWTFVVDQGDGDLIKTASPAFAWKLVKEVEEANVYFKDAAGANVGTAYLMAPGPMSCSPEETLCDWGPSNGCEFDKMCDAVTEEAM